VFSSGQPVNGIRRFDCQPRNNATKRYNNWYYYFYNYYCSKPFLEFYSWDEYTKCIISGQQRSIVFYNYLTVFTDPSTGNSYYLVAFFLWRIALLSGLCRRALWHGRVRTQCVHIVILLKTIFRFYYCQLRSVIAQQYM